MEFQFQPAKRTQIPLGLSRCISGAMLARVKLNPRKADGIFKLLLARYGETETPSAKADGISKTHPCPLG
jgi:hypothetical protein